MVVSSMRGVPHPTHKTWTVMPFCAQCGTSSSWTQKSSFLTFTMYSLIIESSSFH